MHNIVKTKNNKVLQSVIGILLCAAFFHTSIASAAQNQISGTLTVQINNVPAGWYAVIQNNGNCKNTPYAGVTHSNNSAGIGPITWTMRYTYMLTGDPWECSAEIYGTTPTRFHGVPRPGVFKRPGVLTFGVVIGRKWSRRKYQFTKVKSIVGFKIGTYHLSAVSVHPPAYTYPLENSNKADFRYVYTYLQNPVSPVIATPPFYDKPR